MRMPYMCRCPAYGYARPILNSLFFRSDPKTGGPGSSSDAPVRCSPVTQDVAVILAYDDAICCVPLLPRDRLLTTGKCRFAYSLTVVHFRKVVIRRKIGSAGNGHPVI